MGKQSPIIIAVTNKALRDELSEENRKIGGWQDGFDPFYGAPVDFPVATARMHGLDADSVMIGRVVVLPEYRHRGFGRLPS